MMKKILFLVGALVLTGASVWYFNRNGEEVASPYRFVTVEQGDLEAVVASTGTLEPVTTVEVGTQVSGRVSKIFVDFNDKVRRGQVIALIDTTLLVSAVRDAQATIDRNLAQLRQAERELERITPLFEKKFVTEVEYNKALYDVEIAEASVKSAQISLERAQQNLSYATIYAPMDGTVVERNVEVGQTVAASLSAPILFLLANDLSKMQILANVDESDIGMIEEGQTARFTVQAYPDDTFTGMVRQVRLQSTTQENVVNYTVVVDVNNPDGKLLPGMTATVEFLIETAQDVLKIPNAALRFRPTESMMATLRESFQRQREERTQNMPDSVRQRMAERREQQGDGASAGQGTGGATGGGFAGFGGRNGGNRNATMLWYLDANGQVAAMPVRIGITDGQSTEIQPLRGATIEPGMQIIAGVTQVAEEEGAANPFQNQQQGFRRPGSF